MYTQSMTTNQRGKFHFFFRPIIISESRKTSSFFFFPQIRPTCLKVSEHTNHSFSEEQKRGRFRPSRNRTIIFFLSTFFLFKHISFLNRIFRFVSPSTLVDLLKDIFQERSNKTHPVQTTLTKKGGIQTLGLNHSPSPQKAMLSILFFSLFPSQTTQVQLITPQRTYVGSLRTSVPSTPSNRKHQRGISQAKSRFTHQDLPRSHWSHTSA